MTHPRQHRPTPDRIAFTLIELLVVVAVIAVLIAALLPALASARDAARQTQGLSNLRQMAMGWHMYADDNDSVVLPGRFAKQPGGTANPDNHFSLDNGLKYRPRWLAVLGLHAGVSAFFDPSTTDDRQDYASDFFVCPTRPEWTDERNSSYGYNHQFLGNARMTNDRYHHFPVKISTISQGSRTVMAADTMGTAAGAPASQRVAYENNGKDMNAFGNHGWSLDPPRLTPNSDRGSGDPNSLRTAVDPRHPGGRANTAFVDGHAEALTPNDLGYRTDSQGVFIDGPHSPREPGDGPANNLFSGDATDKNPPDLPTADD